MPPLKVGIAALFLAASGVSFAGLIAIVPPADATVFGQAAGYGNTRGIYINADTNFSITSLGEFGYPIGANTLLVASIYASNGTTRGALLASNSLSFPSDGTTMTWQRHTAQFQLHGRAELRPGFWFRGDVPNK